MPNRIIMELCLLMTAFWDHKCCVHSKIASHVGEAKSCTFTNTVSRGNKTWCQ